MIQRSVLLRLILVALLIGVLAYAALTQWRFRAVVLKLSGALKGARQILARFGPEMAISIYHQPTHPVEIPRWVASARAGYQLTATQEFAYFR